LPSREQKFFALNRQIHGASDWEESFVQNNQANRHEKTLISPQDHEIRSREEVSENVENSENETLVVNFTSFPSMLQDSSESYHPKSSFLPRTTPTLEISTSSTFGISQSNKIFSLPEN
jgi:hypothetical protein